MSDNLVDIESAYLRANSAWEELKLHAHRSVNDISYMSDRAMAAVRAAAKAVSLARNASNKEAKEAWRLAALACDRAAQCVASIATCVDKHT